MHQFLGKLWGIGWDWTMATWLLEIYMLWAGCGRVPPIWLWHHLPLVQHHIMGIPVCTHCILARLHMHTSQSIGVACAFVHVKVLNVSPLLAARWLLTIFHHVVLASCSIISNINGFILCCLENIINDHIFAAEINCALSLSASSLFIKKSALFFTAFEESLGSIPFQ